MAEGTQEQSSLETGAGFNSLQSFHVRAVARGDDSLTVNSTAAPVLLPITVVHGAGKYPAIAVGLSVAARLVTAAAALAVLFASTKTPVAEIAIIGTGAGRWRRRVFLLARF